MGARAAGSALTVLAHPGDNMMLHVAADICRLGDMIVVPLSADNSDAVRARQLASGSGVASAFKIIAPPEFLLFEPHQPELCGFYPNTFLDITPVMELKTAAMEKMGAQQYLREYYWQRATHRANHARRINGDKRVQFAEAFQRVSPQVIKNF